MKKSWALLRKNSAVAPIVAEILLVAITVIIAAVVYFMVNGLVSTVPPAPQATYFKSTITHGQMITIGSISRTDVQWSDVKVLLSDGTNFSEWAPSSDDLNGGGGSSHNYSFKLLGSLTVYCWVYDIAGNGMVSGSDYMLIWASSSRFSPSVTYSIVLTYELTGEEMGIGETFSG